MTPPIPLHPAGTPGYAYRCYASGWLRVGVRQSSIEWVRCLGCVDCIPTGTDEDADDVPWWPAGGRVA